MKMALCLGISCWSMAGFLLGQDNGELSTFYDTSPDCGPHHRNHYTIRQTVDDHGQSVLVTNRYIQLTSGLHYWEDGKWKESQALIESHPQGAVARRGPHKVIFDRKVGQEGSIDLLAPDGTRLRSHLVGLCYLDTTTGERTWLGLIKEAEGEILPPNQVIYRDCLDGIKADLRYTYSLSGLEQDLIILEQPPAPEKLDLNSASVRLEVVTEFVDAPLPTVSGKKLRGDPEEELLLSRNYTEFKDERISLEHVHFGVSRAFPETDTAQSELLPASFSGRTAGKRWLKQGERQFLLEQIPYPEIISELRDLPVSRRAEAQENATAALRTAHRTGQFQDLPAAEIAKSKFEPSPMKLAQSMLSLPKGLILDYITLVSPITNFTFKGNETYFVNGMVPICGQVFIEGNTIVKYNTNNGTYLYLERSPETRTGPARPAIFTIKDDDSVGEMIADSSHNPITTDDNYGPAICTSFGRLGPAAFNYFRFKYFRVPLFFYTLQTNPSTTNWVRHSQFYKCRVPFAAEANSVVRVQNVLLDDISYILYPSGNTSVVSCILEHVTVHHAKELNAYPSITFYLTNCLFYNMTNPVPVGPCYSNCVQFTTQDPFSSAGGGGSYLGSATYRNIGTTNIHPRLHVELKTKTTYPPALLTTLSHDTVLGPNSAVLRDLDQPDIGYHYEPIDYLVSSLTLNYALTLTNGVVVGVSGPFGLALANGGVLLSGATPQQHNALVHYKTIQEGIISGETNLISLVTINSSTGTEVNCRFTDFSVLNSSGESRFFTVNSYPAAMVFRDCRFASGTNYFLGPVAFTNCLFQNVGLRWNATSLCMANNTLEGGYFVYEIAPSSRYTIKNNLFDRIWVARGALNGSSTYLSNAYVTTLYGTLYPPEPLPPLILFDCPAYEKGPFGDHYLPLNGVMGWMINGGDGPPVANGLAHYTTSANNWAESGETIADIGMHYVKAQTDSRVYFNKRASSSCASASSQYHVAYQPYYGANEWLNDIWHSGGCGTNEWFRLNLANLVTLSKVTYHPRWACLNGTYLQYAIYVTSSASTNRTDWGSPVAESGWDWPVGAEMKEVTFPPATGQYVIFLCKQGVNNWASGAEFGVYLHGTTTHIPGLPIDTDSDGLPDYLEDTNGNGVLNAGETDFLAMDRWFYSEGSLPPGCVSGDGSSKLEPKALSFSDGYPNGFDTVIGKYLKGYAIKSPSDPEIVDPSATVRLHFYGGAYMTDGVPRPSSCTAETWILHPKVRLDREEVVGGNNRVIFQLQNNASNPEGYKYILQSGTFLSDFQMANIELDCNWPGQPLYNSTAYHDGYKNGGLCIQSVQSKVENVSVYGFGANGPSPLVGNGYAAYPLFLKTASLGQTAVPAPLVIANCTVSNFTGINGGKATAILVETRDHTIPADVTLTGYSQYRAGHRTNTAALVVSNIVVDTRSNECLTGFGLLNSEQVTFAQNRVEASDTGFEAGAILSNPATGYLEVITNIAFLSNTMARVRGGITIGMPNLATNRFANLRIYSNSFRVTGWRPTDAGRWEESYGVRLNGGTSGISIQTNSFASIPSLDFAFPDYGYFGQAPPGFEYFYFFQSYRPTSKVFYPIRVLGQQHEQYPWMTMDYVFGNNFLTPARYSTYGYAYFPVTNGTTYVYVRGVNDSSLYDGSSTYMQSSKFTASADYIELQGTPNKIVTAQLQVPFYFFTNAVPVLTGNSPAVTTNQSVVPN